MTTEIEYKMISRHMLDYAKLMQAEADKLELLGITTVPNLHDKAQEIFYLSEVIGSKPIVLHIVDIES